MLNRNPEIPQIVDKLTRRWNKTPDFSELRMLHEIPVFVYGTLKENRPNHYLLNNTHRYGMVHTLTGNYVMKNVGTGFPVVFDQPDTSPIKAYIRGELYGVSVEHMHVLDHLENNGIMYQRHMRSFILEDQKLEGGRVFKNCNVVKAWIYLGVNEYWKDNKNLTTHSRSTYHNIPVIEGKTFYVW